MERSFDTQALNLQLEEMRALIKDYEQRNAQLTAHNDLLVAALNSLPGYLYIKDRQSRFTFVNAPILKAAGLTSQEQIVGKNDFDFHVPELAEQYLADEQHVMQTGEPLLGKQERSVSIEGQPIWVSTTKAPVRDVSGKIIGVVGFSQDLSEQKALERQIIDNEIRYKAIFDAIQEGVVLQNSDGSIHTCNPSAERILGLTADQMMGRSSIDPRWRSIHEDGSDFPGNTHPAMIALKTGQSQAGTVMGIHKPDGSLSWLMVDAVPLFRAETNTPNGVIASFVDITPLKQAELALRLRDNQFQQLVDHIDQAFWLRDLQTNRFVYMSPAYEAITGKTTVSALENQSSISEMVHKDDLNYVKTAREQHMIDHQDTEYRIVRTDGAIRWIRARTFPVLDEHGAIYQIAGISEDITERKEAEQERLALQIERERAEILKNFLDSASHDLRTPLTVITTSLYLIRRTADPEKRETFLNKIERQADHIHQIIEDLFALSWLDVTPASEFTFVPCNVNILVQDVCEKQNTVLAGKQHLLSLQLDEHLPTVMANEEALEVAIKHLVINAANYTPEQGRITISTRSEQGKVTISICDNGIGISPDDLPFLFDRFYRVDKARSIYTGGSGLGLSIVQQIIEKHQGTIEVESELGSGSTFKIVLPATV